MDFVKLREQAEILQKTEVDFAEPQMQVLPLSRRMAWGSLLSSLAASEKIENLILDPLILAYEKQETVGAYLKAHSRDELKHYNWLSKYVATNTTYKREGGTLSDKIFYDILLPRLGKMAGKKSSFLFALMYFYELFTLEFYSELMAAADQDQLPQAKAVFQLIRQDEVRHCQAAKDLIKLAIQKEGFSGVDRIQLMALLRVFQMDMATFFWCVHNQRVRASTLGLGISPTRMWEMSSKAYHLTLQFVHGEPK